MFVIIVFQGFFVWQKNGLSTETLNKQPFCQNTFPADVYFFACVHLNQVLIIPAKIQLACRKKWIFCHCINRASLNLAPILFNTSFKFCNDSSSFNLFPCFWLIADQFSFLPPPFYAWNDLQGNVRSGGKRVMRTRSENWKFILDGCRKPASEQSAPFNCSIIAPHSLVRSSHNVKTSARGQGMFRFSCKNVFECFDCDFSPSSFVWGFVKAVFGFRRSYQEGSRVHVFTACAVCICESKKSRAEVSAALYSLNLQMSSR